MNGQSQEPGQRSSREDGLGLLYMATNVVATCVTPFMRHSFGVEALGFPGFFALVLMITCTASVPRMPLFIAAWLIALITQRLWTFRLVRKGIRWHSRYAGYPWLAMRMPFVRSEETATGFVEPMICFLAGVALCPLSESLGGLVMLTAPALMIRNGIEKELQRKRLQRMHDAEIEQRCMSDRFRNRDW